MKKKNIEKARIFISHTLVRAQTVNGCEPFQQANKYAVYYHNKFDPLELVSGCVWAHRARIHTIRESKK